MGDFRIVAYAIAHLLSIDFYRDYFCLQGFVSART